MANELERLSEELSENSSAVDSAVALLEDLAEQIRDNANNPAALAQLADDLDANNQRLAAAVAANTPASEEPAPEPEPEAPVDPEAGGEDPEQELPSN